MSVRARTPTTLDELVERVVAGVPAAVARAITWVEQTDDRASELLTRLPARSGQVIGVTGSPGAGKSTLVNALVAAYRRDGAPVGVIAVDPSSPLTGGALLGDRIRLEGTTGDPGVFFRSLASRGAVGGLSDATRAAARVLSAAGFPHVIIETIGAGQAEVEIMGVADSVVLVLIPGSGDEIQAHKAGLLEIADIYVLNKADRPGIDRLRSEIRGRLSVRPSAAWTPPILDTVAHRGDGVTDVIAAIAAHQRYLDHGTGAERVRRGQRAEAVRLATRRFSQAMRSIEEPHLELLDRGVIDEDEAARRLVDDATKILHDPDDASSKRPRGTTP